MGIKQRAGGEAAGRQLRSSLTAGQTIWHYDSPQKGLGRLSDVVNPDGITKSYTYAGLGQGGAGQVRSVQLTAGADSLTTTLDYDAFGRLTTITSPACARAGWMMALRADTVMAISAARPAVPA